MAVNLEELALKSIEQYAALGVRLISLEQTLSDNNRRAESNQDKFIAACDKISRLEEKISSMTSDKELIHRRIDDTREEIDKLVRAVNELTGKVKCHDDTHCDDCTNIDKIDVLEKKITHHATGNKYLVEIRKTLSSTGGVFTVKFLMSRWYLFLMTAYTLNVGFTIWIHHQALKDVVATFKFW